MSAVAWDFRGQCALVSGGARGIGAAIVRRLAASGADVVFGDTDSVGGRELTAELGGHARFVAADFGEAGAWPALLQDAASAGWAPSLVVANVGINPPGRVEEFSLEVCDRVLRTNQRSMWLAAHDTVPALRRRPGSSLLFTSSVMARFGSHRASPYIMTKAAISGLVKSLCVELAPDGIRVNAILPGYIQIDPPHYFRERLPRALWDEFFAVFRDHFLRRAGSIQPLALAGSPEDIAQAVCFLHSDAARFISGTELVVDGGLLCQSPIAPGRGDDAQGLTPEMTAWFKAKGITP